ncbi:MAG TPA: hypothetical protein VKG01_14930 [Thermoanaerobaculia bacterium]|nr:hypothetical protein [Thermoanaerobaculia bacterium]
MIPVPRRAGPAILLVLLVAAAYSDPLLARRNFGGRDVLGGLLPMEFAIHDAYSRGRLPVWAADISGGRPLLANPNTSALYPLRAALAVIPFPFAMRLFPVLHWILAGLGALALLSELRASKAGAWIGAVTFAFSGVIVSEVFYTNHMGGVVLLPWILWAVARRWKTRAGQVAALSTLFGIDFLAGEVFTMGMALAASALWILVEEEKIRRWPMARRLSASVAMGALIGAPQLLATYLWIPETDRAIRGVLLRDAVAFSVSPLRLFEFLVPYPFGTTWKVDPSELWALPVFHGKWIGLFATLHCGALAVLAVAASRLGRPRAKTKGAKQSAPPATLPRGARFTWYLLAGSLALAVLPSLVPSWLGDLPSPVALRSPEKFCVAVSLAMALAAGLFFERLRGGAVRVSWALAVGAGLALLAALTAVAPGFTAAVAELLTGVDAKGAARAAGLFPAAVAEGGLLWMATAVALDLLRRNTPRAAGAALAIATLVPVAANRKIAQTYPEEVLLGPTPIARLVKTKDPEGAFRVLSEAGYQPSELDKREFETDPGGNDAFRRNWLFFTQALWKYGTVLNTDFDSGNLSRAESLRRLSFVEGYWSSPAFFGSLALKWGVRYRDQLELPGYRPFGGNAVQGWDVLDSALPDIRLVERWHERPGPAEAMELLGKLPAGEIVLESGRSADGSARPGTLKILERSPERLRLETRSPDPIWLFVLRGFWPHRTVKLDGREAPVFASQLAFSAMVVPAGTHRIDWRERVPGGAFSMWGPVLYLLLAGALALAEPRDSTKIP